MVLKSYIFSKVSGNYQQYALDFTEPLFKSCLNNKNVASNRIVAHRDGNLIYYIFIYINPLCDIYGHCIVTGELCTDIQWLYDLFLMAFDSSAQKGILFSYDTQGNVRKQVADFSSAGAEVDLFFRTFKEAVEIKSKWKPLQPIDFTVSKDSSITLSLNEDKKAKIVEATEHYHNVVISEFNDEPSSYAMTVKNLNAEREKLCLKITSLEDKVSNLTKQKKQTGWVALLAFVVIAMLIGMLALKNIFSDEISRMDMEAMELRETISKHLATIDETRDSLQEMSDTNALLLIENENFQNKIRSIQNMAFRGGSDRRIDEPSMDNNWCEWIEVMSPINIVSFYTWASNSGTAVVVAYNEAHQKVAESVISVRGGQWQEVLLNGFSIKETGKYYLCMENTSVKFGYHSASASEDDFYRQGALHVIGATKANIDNPKINKGYYQYFYSIQYTLI